MVLPTAVPALASKFPKQPEKTPKQKCEEKGGTWNELLQTCELKQIDFGQGTPTSTGPTTPREQIAREEAQRQQAQQRQAETEARQKSEAEAALDKPIGAGITLDTLQEQPQGQPQGEETTTQGQGVNFLPNGTVDISFAGQTVNLTREEYETAFFRKGGQITEEIKLARQLNPQAQAGIQGQQLAGQVGQFGQLGVSPTGLNTAEGLTQGIVDSIPEALRLGTVGAGLGFAGGSVAGSAAGPIGSGAGAAIGVTAGFIGGLARGMISSFKSQRRDTTTAQQRILDEGKQTMKDWSTMAKNDPTNKQFYLGQYNQVSAQIDQAYRQMKLDTSRDVGKFETALPNLAEFEAFYSLGGERDALNVEMENSLLTPGPLNYDLLELQNRRKNVK